MAVDINPAQLAACFELVEGKYPKVRDDIVFILGTIADASVPTAVDELTGGLYIDENSTGVADTLQMVMKNTGDTFAAVTVNNGLAGARWPVLSADALDAATVVTLTDAQSGSVIDLDMATVTVNLPALTAANSGANGIFFKFITSATASAQVITAGAGDILSGGVIIMSTSAGVENDAFSANGSTDLSLTMNGTTKGGINGSVVSFHAESATKWLVEGQLIGSGTLVTGFS